MVDIILVTCKTKEEVKDQIDEIMKNTDGEYNLIATCRKTSAAINRNYGLAWVTSEIVVMIDDDIQGFYKGWLEDLIEPLKDDNVILSSARLIRPDGRPASMMGGEQLPFDDKTYDALISGYKGYRRVTTACIAFRNNGIKFDEGFVSCGYEDTDFMNRINIKHPNKKIVVVNKCKLIHLNKMTKQGGKYWQHNHNYYLSLYPDDLSVKKQTCWVPYREEEQ